jgi:hypothetical protein
LPGCRLRAKRIVAPKRHRDSGDRRPACCRPASDRLFPDRVSAGGRTLSEFGPSESVG